jgi:hypothetical protein
MPITYGSSRIQNTGIMISHFRYDTATISDCLAAAGLRAPASVERGAAAALDSADYTRSGSPPGSSACL